MYAMQESFQFILALALILTGVISAPACLLTGFAEMRKTGETKYFAISCIPAAIAAVVLWLGLGLI